MLRKSKISRLTRKEKRDKFQFELLEPRHLFSVSDGSAPAIEHMGVVEDVSFDHHVESIQSTEPAFGTQADQALTSFLYLPMVNAGPNASVNAFATLQLNGEVIVNIQDNLSLQWSKLSGPGTATFGNTSAANSTVQFNQAGTYVLQLAATNHGVTALSQLTVNVAAANVVNIDQTWLANTANQVTVNGRTAYVLKQADKTYVLQTDVTTAGDGFFIANSNITFDLNGHSVTYNTANLSGPNDLQAHPQAVHGIVLYHGSGHNGVAIPGGTSHSNAIIKNGKIINAHAGNLSHGIYAYLSSNLLIENMQVETDGKDSHSVYISWDDFGAPTIRDSILTTHSSTTFDRHMLPANVFVGGKLVAERNLLLGGNSGFNSKANSIITANVIAQSGFATNGYAAAAHPGSVIKDNIVLPLVSGRGIFLNSGGTITDNVILHLEQPNAEFGEELNAPATRARYDTTGGIYSNNVSLGIAGGAYTSATSIYLTTYGTGSNSFTNNDATTVLIGAPTATHYAQPVSLEGTGKPGSGAVGPGLDIIANNHFKSNHKMVTLGGYEGGGQQLTPLTGNTWDWVDGGTAYTDFMAAVNAKLQGIEFSSSVKAAVDAHVATTDDRIEGLISGQGLQASRAFWRTDAYSSTALYADILNSTFGAGVDPKSYGSDTTTNLAWKMREGFTKRVQLLDGVTPQANTQVTVTTPQGDSYTLKTDANGFADLTFYRFAITAPGTPSAAFTVINRAQSTISAAGKSIVISHSNVPNQIDLAAIPGGQSATVEQQSSASSDLSVFLAHRVLRTQQYPSAPTVNARLVEGSIASARVADVPVAADILVAVYERKSRTASDIFLVGGRSTNETELREVEEAFAHLSDLHYGGLL